MPNAPVFRDKVTDLAGPIHGKSKYALASDHVREQRRFRRLRPRGYRRLGHPDCTRHHRSRDRSRATTSRCT